MMKLKKKIEKKEIEQNKADNVLDNEIIIGNKGNSVVE